MKSLKISLTATFILACISVIGLGFQFLALTDIFHQEPDVSLEWNVVKLSYIIQILFTASAFITLALIVKTKSLFFEKTS